MALTGKLQIASCKPFRIPGICQLHVLEINILTTIIVVTRAILVMEEVGMGQTGTRVTKPEFRRTGKGISL